MTIQQSDSPSHELVPLKPYALVGAGRLTSALWKIGDEQTGWHYRFNVFWMTNRGRVGQRFSPADLLDLVKLVRVLAATLAEDGCLSPARRSELTQLAELLDQVIQPEN